MTDVGRTVTVEMTVRQWYFIDRFLDNDISIESVGGDETVVVLSTRIREAGWEQVSGWTRQRPISNRPPPDSTCAVSLNPHMWDRVLSSLADWATVHTNTGDDILARDLREFLQQRLGDVSENEEPAGS